MGMTPLDAKKARIKEAISDVVDLRMADLPEETVRRVLFGLSVAGWRVTKD